jgi:hypothetical protein
LAFLEDENLGHLRHYLPEQAKDEVFHPLTGLEMG